ncbi:rna helicase [Holotrichia oblita]|uniref:Rna helicase n=1 Tax=Holotrichia oblita TaxID=644536 RepID=A0ACB9T9D6_HOLOL|nr:rna helicase [Holotrichia oblita]
MKVFSRNIIKQVLKQINIREYSAYSTKLKTNYQNEIIISCKNKKLNFYKNQLYDKLDNMQLASKGWTHNKSRGDYFTIHPNYDDFDKPNVKLEDIQVNPKLVEVLNKENISLATNYQSEAIPIVRSGKHVVLAAETGCGKTITYLIPIIEKLIACKNENGFNTPSALIIVPNRELAHQIGGVAKILGEYVNLNVKVVTGGKTKKLMLNPEFSDIDILIATPGAISKLSTVGIYKLNKVLHTVFDEADTLLDDSFTDKIETLAKRVSQSQMIFTSATLPRKFPDVFEPIIQNISYVKSPRLHRPLLNVNQKFLRLTRSGRPTYLLEIAKTIKSPLLIFSNKNATCDWISMFLREHGIKCTNINASMNYYIRIDHWQQFIKEDVNILSATDIGSRGLDTTQVKHVLNYDFPLYASDYIHRIGRVGRLGSVMDCKITNFITGTRDIKLVQQIESAIRTNTEIPNVDGNIKAIIQKRILKSLRESG